MTRFNNNRSSPGRAAPIVLVLFAASALCVGLLVVRAYRLEEVEYRFMIWNLFLAWLPLAASAGATALSVRSSPPRAAVVALAALWLLFFPNAPYLTTDFIHLIMSPDYAWSDQKSLLIWFDIVLFFLFAWIGLLLGYASMRQMHEQARRLAGAAAGWTLAVACSFLGGFGIYLGRIARLNSWDLVFSPLRLLDGVAQGLNRTGAAFALLFGAMILIVYLSLYALRGLELSRRNGDGESIV